MALWDALAPAATVAQLVGVDAAGLISATLQAVRTARRNRRECQSLARRVMMVGDLLLLVQQGSSETMRRPEVRVALEGLGGALRRAFELVESCQERGAAYGFIRAARQAEQFRDVQSDIDSYLLVFPVVTHIDMTIRLDRIYNMLLTRDDSAGQVSDQAPSSSSVSPLERSSRLERNSLEVLQPESSRIVEEPLGWEENQRAGIRQLRYGAMNIDLLRAVSKNFSSELAIGHGGAATVYKAHVHDGTEVAIKRFRLNGKGSSQYYKEFHVLPELDHTNIIKVLGYCTDQRNILVYEYMPNKSLRDYIFDAKRGALLDWPTCLRIVEGVARGLIYLHGQRQRIVHRDLKPGNILLDFDMSAKISDFGMAKMLSEEQHQEAGVGGTYGYICPVYLRKGILSTKVDVFAYGVTLLEIISGKRFCIEDAWYLWTAGRSFELIHQSLYTARTTEITRCIQIALLCIQTDPADRPSMSHVLQMLRGKKRIDNPNLPAAPGYWDGYVYQFTAATWSSSGITMPR